MKLTDTSDLTPFKSLLMFTTFALVFTITLSTLLEPIEMIICFLDSILVVILSLGFFFYSILLITLWILETLSADSFKKDSLILMISLILFDEACIYTGLIDTDNVQFFLKNFNLARILLLSLGGIREGIFNTLACLSCLDEP